MLDECTGCRFIECMDIHICIDIQGVDKGGRGVACLFLTPLKFLKEIPMKGGM